MEVLDDRCGDALRLLDVQLFYDYIKGKAVFLSRIDYFRFRCDLGLLFLLVRNSFFDLLPFFIGHSNINFMGGGAVPNRQGITLAGNGLAGQVRGYRFLRYRVHSCADEVVKIQRRKLLVNQV